MSDRDVVWIDETAPLTDIEWRRLASLIGIRGYDVCAKDGCGLHYRKFHTDVNSDGHSFQEEIDE